MEEKKSVRACYEEIKRREEKELEDAVRAAGGMVEFDEDNAPIVMCNFGGFSPHPADVRITRVELRDEEDEDVLYIFGEEKDESGCAEWYEDEMEINISDIAYSHIDFITSALPKKKVREISDETSRLCETVAELSAILYAKLYRKYQDSFDTSQEIIRLSIQFEARYDRNTMDFLDEIDKFADDYLKKISS